MSELDLWFLNINKPFLGCTVDRLIKTPQSSAMECTLVSFFRSLFSLPISAD